MTNLSRRALFAALAAVAFGLHSQPGAAEDAYPSQPVTIVVPFAAGGGVDILTRVLAEHLSESLGQPVVIENRTGAGGAVGSQLAANAAPDGYTLLMGTSGTHAINPGLYADLPYDPLGDFEPITPMVSVNNLLLVNSEVPATTVAELLELARERPGELSFGSFGPGTSNHLSGELLNHMEGLDIVHIPYGSAPDGMADLIAGQIEVMFVNMPLGLQHIGNEAIRALAVTGSQRSSNVPDLPTMIEAGVEDYVVEHWWGLLAPKGTPEPIVARLNEEMVAALENPEVREFFASRGVEPMPTTPAEFRAIIESEIPKWEEVIEISGAAVN